MENEKLPSEEQQKSWTDNLGETAENLKDKAGNLAEKIGDKASDLWHATEEKTGELIDKIKSSDLTEETKEKAHLLYQSLHKLLSLPDSVIVLPAHTGIPVEFDNKMIRTTIGEAKKNIPLLKLHENEFVNSILQKMPPTPANFLTIIEKNIKGEYGDVNVSELELGANRCEIK